MVLGEQKSELKKYIIENGEWGWFNDLKKRWKNRYLI